MAMTNQKILEAVGDLYAVFTLKGIPAVRMSPHEMTKKRDQLSAFAIRCHLAFVCAEIPRMLEDGKREKAFRWLGWLQGATWALGYSSLETLKKMNMPAEVSA